jgi:hypothetical protein
VSRLIRSLVQERGALSLCSAVTRPATAVLTGQSLTYMSARRILYVTGEIGIVSGGPTGPSGSGIEPGNSHHGGAYYPDDGSAFW